MPRKPRFFLPGVPAHIVQRGHNRQAIFFDDSDYLVYLSLLENAAQQYECAIHAYVLMTNHVHILATPSEKDSISRMMQAIGRRYVPYINHEYARSGTLWEGRYKASLISEESYLFACMRYIELNPVRAGIVEAPADYTWTSYHANAFGKEDPLVTRHVLYQSLGKNDAARSQAYRELFRDHINRVLLHEIRSALQTGTPLGSDRFRKGIEVTLGTKVGQVNRGRPRKKIGS